MAAGEQATLNLTVCRVDKERREVWGVATTETLGTDGRIHDFDGSIRAVTRWMAKGSGPAPEGVSREEYTEGGIVHDYHQPHKAAGRAFTWQPIPDERAIYVGVRVSRGAEDTWKKLLDGTYRYFSINGPIHHMEPRRVEINGQLRTVPWVTDWDMDELSFVPNGGDRKAQITSVVRSADGFSAVVDDGELEPLSDEYLTAARETREAMRAAPAFEGAKCPYCQGPAKGEGDKSDCTCDEDCGSDVCPKADDAKAERADTSAVGRYSPGTNERETGASAGNEPEDADRQQPSCPFCTATRGGIEGAAENNSDTACTCQQDCGASGCHAPASGALRAAPTHEPMIGTHAHEHADYGTSDNPDKPHNHKHTHGTQPDGGGDPIPDANHGHHGAVAQRRDMDPNVGGGVDRDKMPAEDFAGPDRTYPIDKPGDVSDAASLIGKADDPDAVKAKIISIAKRKGATFVAELPKAWTDGDTASRADDGAGTDVTAASEMAQVKQAMQARELIKALIASESAENDDDADALGGEGFDLGNLAKALEHLENFISSETWEASSKATAALRSASSDEEEFEMGVADDILKAVNEIKEQNAGLVQRVEALEGAEVTRAENSVTRADFETLVGEVKRIGDQPASGGPALRTAGIPVEKLFPGELGGVASDESSASERVLREMAERSRDDRVRGLSQNELTALLVREAPLVSFEELAKRAVRE